MEEPNRDSTSTETEARDAAEQVGLLEEYRTLRAEIASNSHLTATVFTWAITATGALIGVGVAQAKWAVFLVPFAILLPSLWFITSQLESTVRIAEYIRTRIEPHVPGMGWETSLHALRANKLLPERKYVLSITDLYGGIALACLVLAWVFRGDYSAGNIAVLSVLTVVLGAAVLLVVGRAQRSFGAASFAEYYAACVSLTRKEGGPPSSQK
jgi:hypothetical protein